MDKVNGLLQKIGSGSDTEEICKYLDESQVDINQGGNVHTLKCHDVRAKSLDSLQSGP